MSYTSETQRHQQLRVMRRIRGNQRLAGPDAVAAAGGGSTGRGNIWRLVAAGHIEIDPEWAGCYRLTATGYSWLDGVEEAEDRTGEYA